MRVSGISNKGFSRIAQRVSKTAGTEPRVYVGTYGKYNSGSIDGAWLDLSDYSSLEEFYEAARELHKDEEDPEFMFQDHEGIPEGMISESHIDPAFFDFLAQTSDWDDEQREAFDIFMEYMWSGSGEPDDVTNALTAFEDSYRGVYNSMEDYALEFVEDMGGPENISNPEFYFDYEQFGRDLGFDGYYEEEGSVYDQDGEETGYSTIEEMIDSWMDDGVIAGETMSRYFDYEKFGRDLELGGDMYFRNGHVFDNNY